MRLLDVSGDFEDVCNDFHGTATLRIDGIDTTLPQVLVEPKRLRELEPSGAAVVRSGMLFVWSRTRSDSPPLGSIIIDPDGVYWTIWKLTTKRGVETYEAFVLNLNIVTADEHVARVLVGEYGKGRANEASVIWRGYWSRRRGGGPADDVAARFQPSSETARLLFGADTTWEVYRVYFHDPVPVDLAGGEYRLVDTEGNRYRIVEYHQEGRIDRLPVAIAVKINEGVD